MKRRDFLQTTALASASLFVPKLITASALDLSQVSKNARILIVIQWSGGNDGLNTVIPFTDDLYYKLQEVRNEMSNLKAQKESFRKELNVFNLNALNSEIMEIKR